MADPQKQLTHRFSAAIAASFGDELAEVDPLIKPSQNPQFGDYQANVAMSLGKRLGQKPRDVAAAIVAKLEVGDLCEEPEIAGPGFINLRLSGGYLAGLMREMLADAALGVEPAETRQRVVVDYSGPNVAKEMHVGHIRSTVIGDALVRVLEARGHTVVKRNHLGDWGTQFGMLIEHMADTGADGGERFEVADLNTLYREAKQKFDEDTDFADRARQRVVALQRHEEQTLKLWRALVAESQRHFNAVYARLGVALTDDDVMGESAYNALLPDVVAELEQAGIVTESEGAAVAFVEGFESPMIVRKRDGGYGYDATDLAAVRQRVRDEAADRLVYVTDARQKQHFAMVFDVAQRAGWLSGATAEHVPFGTILGEDGKPFKTRSGETVRLADLLDEAERRAAAIVAEKNPSLDEAARREVARMVGIGAIKYADLSNDRTRDYVFSWPRMLAMDGNTGPYLQYAHARIRSIFRKAKLDGAPAGASGAIAIDSPHERALALTLARLSPTLGSVSEKLEPHHLCGWLYELATAFSGFYENCPVLKTDDEQVRAGRLALCELSASALKRGLELLGIEAPERM